MKINHYFILRENKPNQTQFQTQPLSAPKTPQFLRATCAFGATPAVLFPHPDESGEPDVFSEDSKLVFS